MTISKDVTLGEIVSNDFKAAAVFSRYNLDFCCNGKMKITEACSRKGLNFETVIDEISKASIEERNILHFNYWDASFLSEYIVANHHSYVRDMMPIILKHAEKAARVHCMNHPELKEIYSIFCEVSEEMSAHMDKEEKIIFPYIKKLASKENEYFVPPFGSINNPISVMEHEHKNAADAMSKIKELSSNYTAYSDMCETCRVLYKELKDFEEDLHVHVHLENNILFPMAVKLEEHKIPVTVSCSL